MSTNSDTAYDLFVAWPSNDAAGGFGQAWVGHRPNMRAVERDLTTLAWLPSMNLHAGQFVLARAAGDGRIARYAATRLVTASGKAPRVEGQLRDDLRPAGSQNLARVRQNLPSGLNLQAKGAGCWWTAAPDPSMMLYVASIAEVPRNQIILAACDVVRHVVKELEQKFFAQIPELLSDGKKVLDCVERLASGQAEKADAWRAALGAMDPYLASEHQFEESEAVGGLTPYDRARRLLRAISDLGEAVGNEDDASAARDVVQNAVNACADRFEDTHVSTDLERAAMRRAVELISQRIYAAEVLFRLELRTLAQGRATW